MYVFKLLPPGGFTAGEKHGLQKSVDEGGAVGLGCIIARKVKDFHR
jgi:hypothetical protein